MRLIIFFVAIALAVGTFVLVAQYTAPNKETPIPVATPQPLVQEVPSIDVWTAKQDIPIGAVITKEMVDAQPYPKNLLLEGMMPADPNQPLDVLKMVARSPFQKGEPLFRSRLANEKDPSFLAGALPKGKRVVTIAVDPVSGVAGFVFPGDHVDVLVTHEVETGKSLENDGAGRTINSVPKKDPVTEVLLSNIKVMAVNQKAQGNNAEPPVLPSSVSLEVTPIEAQKLRLTENGNGRLSLALRSLRDQDENELTRPTGLSDLSRLTPPAYFPVLYDASGKPNVTEGAAAPEAQEESIIKVRTLVNVVRGVRVESVEVSQP